MMNLTYIGHAGFLIETDKSIILNDPWVSEGGAFDYSWFQFPRNDYYFDFLINKLNNSQKEIFIYISHEHKDHFDKKFISSLKKDIKYLIPNFRRKIFENQLNEIVDKKNIHLFNDSETKLFNEINFTIFVDDNESDHDSALLMKYNDKTFLNLNDCHIFDRSSYIKKNFGNIDLYTCQHSGANWHPICYDYPEDRKQKIGRNKSLSKYVSILNSIKELNPKLWVPSAGPPCFLDPELFHFNFEDNNTLTHQEEVINYLQKFKIETKISYLNLHDQFSFEKMSFTHRDKDPIYKIDTEKYKKHLIDYQSSYLDKINSLKSQKSNQEYENILNKLKENLSKKINSFPKEKDYKIKIIFSFNDFSVKSLIVDFSNLTINYLDKDVILKDKYYYIQCPLWQYESIINGTLTWEDFSACFRMNLSRVPDIYDTLIHGFLYLEAEDIPFLSDYLDKVSLNDETVEITSDNCKYKISKYCPHQGADLSYGWTDENGNWVCPRHRWKFDLDTGKCINANYQISSKKI